LHKSGNTGFVRIPKSLAKSSSLVAGKVSEVHLLGHESKLEWVQDESGLTIKLPQKKPCEHAFAFKIAGLRWQREETAPTTPRP
jgi:alpha-L-fucosidase